MSSPRVRPTRCAANGSLDKSQPPHRLVEGRRTRRPAAASTAAEPTRALSAGLAGIPLPCSRPPPRALLPSRSPSLPALSDSARSGLYPRAGRRTVREREARRRSAAGLPRGS
eukprot:7376510-Prymnesium_polylepis.1